MGRESCWFPEENLPLKPMGYAGSQAVSCNPACSSCISSSSVHHLCMAVMLLKQTHTGTDTPGSSRPQQQGRIHPLILVQTPRAHGEDRHSSLSAAATCLQWATGKEGSSRSEALFFPKMFQTTSQTKIIQ